LAGGQADIAMALNGERCGAQHRLPDNRDGGLNLVVNGSYSWT
jgi:hypothetical protein